MSFQPLTKEQYEQARQQFSHSQIMEMEKQRKQEGQQTTPDEGGGLNLAQQIGQSAIGSTLVRPAVRTGQAIAASGLMAFGGEETRERVQQRLQEPTTVPLGPLGDYEIPPVKAGTKAARQIIGETLEAGSWLYGPPKAGASVGVGLAQGMARSGGFLAKHGAIAGGMFGLGEGLQDEDQDALDVAGTTAMGAGAGAIGGGVLGAAMPAAPIALRGLKQAGSSVQDFARGGLQKGASAARAGAGMARSVAEGAGNVPLRMGDRAIEASQKAAQRQTQMRAAAPHVREAMKQGVPDDWVKIATVGTETDKLARADMLELAKAATDVNYTGPRPVSKVGEQINQGPVRRLIEVKDQGVSKTKQLLDSMPKEPQRVDNVRQQFVEDMGLAGVRVEKGKLVANPGSRIPKSDLSFYQQVYDDIAPGELTYQQMHQLRQKFFDTAKTDQLYTDGTTSYARQIRSYLTKEIDEYAGGQYFDSQVQTREAMTSLGEYARLIGYKGDIENMTTKDLKAGEVFMRVFGNASDRPTTVLNDLYSTAGKYGYQGQENIIQQLRFADMLEDVYGQPSRSLGGQVGRATSPTADPTQTMASGVREMVKWSPYSGAIRLMRASGLLGKRPEDIMRSFENMVLTEAGRPMQTQAVSPIREAVSSVGENLRRGVEDGIDNVMR